MNREVYLWIIFFIAVIAGAVYLRYYYQPAISLSLSMNASQGSAFPYQKMNMPITLANTGSSPIVNLSFGIFVDNQLHTLYRVTLPAGKQTTIPFNLTFTSKGTYRVEAIADPGRLYNILDRAAAQANVSVVVYNDSKDEPFIYLPGHAIVQESASMDNFGFDVFSYLYQNYNANKFSIFQMEPINQFLEPIFNITSTYIRNVSYSYAVYENGTAYSIWINGYLEPSIMGFAARAKNLSTSSASINGENVTVIRINQNTTFCSWYEGGWIKNLAYEGDMSCTTLISASEAGIYTDVFQAGPYNGLPKMFNNTYDANFSYRSRLTTVTGAGILKHLGGGAIIFTSINSNLTPNDTCLGVIGTVNNTKYCSEYILPRSGAVGNLSLIRTDANMGIYNLSVLSLSNTMMIESQLQTNIGLVRAMNVTGRSLQFVSGVKNTCLFDSNFTCANATLSNDTLKFTLKNRLNSTVNLTGIYCFWNVPGAVTPLNASLAYNKTLGIEATCYNSTRMLSGAYLNLKLGLVLDYRRGSGNSSALGSAYIVGSG